LAGKAAKANETPSNSGDPFALLLGIVEGPTP
jgi:hypothetical protein